MGPNGAGKTTTIKMLCGLLKMSGGEAHINGRQLPDHRIAAEIGYMPQETALYLGLTVHQNMAFFGEIFGLSKREIEEREKALLEFINLPEWRDELVGNLSGGMKHRVSLACALIHQPPLLLLDEPTVGVDPELRVSFWDYFNDIKSEGRTIVITTHYMDEAGRCDRIGFMHNGQPDSRGEARGTAGDDRDAQPRGRVHELHHCRQGGGGAMRKPRFLTVTKRIFTDLKNDKRSLALIVIAPIFVMFVFGLAFGGEVKNVKVVVVNQDQGAAPGGAGSMSLSEEIISNLDTEVLKLEYVDDRDAALAMVENGDAYGVIIFPADFTSEAVSSMNDLPGGSYRHHRAAAGQEQHQRGQRHHQGA